MIFFLPQPVWAQCRGLRIVTQNLTQFSRLMVQVFQGICILFSVMTAAKCCTLPFISRQRWRMRQWPDVVKTLFHIDVMSLVKLQERSSVPRMCCAPQRATAGRLIAAGKLLKVFFTETAELCRGQNAENWSCQGYLIYQVLFTDLPESLGCRRTKLINRPL